MLVVPNIDLALAEDADHVTPPSVDVIIGFEPLPLFPATIIKPFVSPVKNTPPAAAAVELAFVTHFIPSEDVNNEAALVTPAIH